VTMWQCNGYCSGCSICVGQWDTISGTSGVLPQELPSLKNYFHCKGDLDE